MDATLCLIRCTLLVPSLNFITLIDLFHNGGQIKYCSVLMLIKPFFQSNVCFKMRAVGLINNKRMQSRSPFEKVVYGSAFATSSYLSGIASYVPEKVRDRLTAFVLKRTRRKLVRTLPNIAVVYTSLTG